jgi:tRNA threonylcarbamoyl adenosine modification protein YeaZ/ribosomal-protein-alanine acetyltransferase
MGSIETMKRALTIDTSTNHTIVGVVEGKEVIWSESIEGATSHGGALGELVSKAEGLATVDHVIVGMGPGPFTGLRVGIIFAQGFAKARAIPCIGVVSLDAIAYSLEFSKEITISIDARRKERYWARYDQSGERISEISVSKVDEVPRGIVDEYPTPIGLLRAANHPRSIRTEPLYLRKPDAALKPLTEIHLRELRSFDLGEIVAIERELFPDPWSLGQFKEELSFSPRSRYYVVLEDRSGAQPRIAGYAGIAFTGIGEPVDIHTVSVAKEYQGRGLGHRLLDHLVERAKELKASSILLEVRDGNEPARALYGKNGFTEISRRVGYYARFGDALVMEKPLGEAGGAR